MVNELAVIERLQIPASFTVYKKGSLYYAKSFGEGVADIPGNADAAIVIQNAINALTSGGLIMVKAGTYQLLRAILVNKSNLIIKGEGVENTKFLTSFTGGTPDNAFAIGLGLTSGTGNTTGSITDVMLADFTIDMQQTASILAGSPDEKYGNCILALGCQRVTIRNVRARNCHTHNIYFRLTDTTTDPSSPAKNVLKNNSIEDCISENAMLGMYYDAISAYPTNARYGTGNKMINCTAKQDWATYSLASQTNGQGFADWGNIATMFVNCHAEGYTPNPSIPANTQYGGFTFEGKGSPVMISCSAYNCYYGIRPNVSGGGGGIGAQITDFSTLFVRYPVSLQGGSDDDIIINGLVASNLSDAISLAAGVVLHVNYQASNVGSLIAMNVRGIRDSNINQFGVVTGNDAILQTVGSAAKSIQLIGGDQTSLLVGPAITTRPTFLKIEKIRGYNPQGWATASPSVPASGVDQQNTFGYPVFVYITGLGTGISAVGITDNAATLQSFTRTGEIGDFYRLEPGDKIRLTYTGSPTWKWYGL